MTAPRPRRSSRHADAAPCACLVCQAAGAHLRSVQVPPDETSAVPRWLHGEELIRWWAARDRARAAFRDLTRQHGMPRTTGESPRRA